MGPIHKINKKNTVFQLNYFGNNENKATAQNKTEKINTGGNHMHTIHLIDQIFVVFFLISGIGFNFA